MVTLPDALAVLGYPVGPVVGGNAAVVSDGQIVYWPTQLGDQPTAQQIAAVTEQQVTEYYSTISRQAAVSLLSSSRAEIVKLARAVAVVAWKADNAGRQWEADLKAAVAAATSLADLKARVAAIPARPVTSAQDLRDAIQAALLAGEGD